MIIQCIKNKQAICDDIDADYLKQFRWTISTTGYAVTSTAPHEYMHRLVAQRMIVDGMIQSLDNFHVDHINRKRNDNRRANLRLSNHSSNMMNSGKQRYVCSSKYKNVTKCKSSGKWRVSIIANKQFYYGGLFETELEAAAKANELMQLYHGKFARLNKL